MKNLLQKITNYIEAQAEAGRYSYAALIVVAGLLGSWSALFFVAWQILEHAGESVYFGIVILGVFLIIRNGIARAVERQRKADDDENETGVS